MPFSYISDLPPQIQQVLDVQLQELWLATFNTVVATTANESEAYQTAWMKVFQAAFPGQIAMPSQMPNMMPQAVATSNGSGLQYSEPTMGYWLDLNTVSLDEQDGLTWLQAMPLGTYNHPVHGKIEITPERVQRFATNINNNVRGIELDIDYDHKEKTNEAAGWVKKAEARPDGLWIAVEWVGDALTKLKNKVYRYFSPEFVNKWTHPKTNQTYNDVMFGGALTNRPFLKDILPINFSEIIPKGGSTLDPKKVAKMLGLPEDATEEQIEAALAAKVGQDAGNAGTPAETSGEAEGGSTTPPAGEPASASVEASESITPQMIALAESDPVVRTLVDRIATLETANRLSEVNISLSEMTTGPRALAPAVVSDVRNLALELPHALSEKFLTTLKNILKGGIVELAEAGYTRGTDTSGGDAVQRFTEAVDKAMKANDKLTYTDAVEQIAAADPMLFTEYRDSVYVKEGAK